ncbi:MAG: invasion associated locus B family protein [Pseudomonadota bacterium]
MTSKIKTIAAGLLTVVAMTVGATVTATAQDRVEAHKDWSVFEAGEGGQKVCWIVSQPTKWVAKRDNKTVQVNRGDIFLMVAVRKADKVKNEVSFLSGYPFKKGSQVKVAVASRGGNKRYTLFTDGENAWTSSPGEDNTLTGAFRAGRTAEVVGESQRGTTTVDTFSLSGFTAAIKAAQKRCQ